MNKCINIVIVSLSTYNITSGSSIGNKFTPHDYFLRVDTMGKTPNKHMIPAYVKKNQIHELRDIRRKCKDDYGLSISIAEQIRTGIDLFLKKINDEGLEAYLQDEGYL